EGGQQVVTVAAGGTGDEEADQAPEEAEEGAEHEVGRIHEQHRAFAPFGLAQTGPEFGLHEIGLLLRVCLGRDGPDLAPAQTKSFFKKARTWVRLRQTPVSRSMAAWASRVERGGVSSDESSHGACWGAWSVGV